MAANNISTLQYKRDRQDQKLALAATKRENETPQRPYILDANLLPTRYGINSNDADDIVDNPNTGGLVLGRPWT